MQVCLSACTPRAFGDDGVRFATQLAAPHLARLWLPSTERHVLLPASAFVAAAASAAPMLHGDSQRRRPTLTGDSHRLNSAYVGGPMPHSDEANGAPQPAAINTARIYSCASTWVGKSCYSDRLVVFRSCRAGMRWASEAALGSPADATSASCAGDRGIPYHRPLQRQLPRSAPLDRGHCRDACWHAVTPQQTSSHAV
jgi:hypothetical protein